MTDWSSEQHEYEHEVSMLALLPKLEQSAVFLRVIKRKLDETRNDLEDAPKMDPVDATKDVKYMLGFINGLKWCLSRPGEAQKCLEHWPQR